MDNATVREFHQPADEAAAVELLARKSPSTAPLLIGPRVSDNLYKGLEVAVDLSRLGLSYIQDKSGAIRIGALTTLQALSESELLRKYAGGIVAEAASFSAGSALRQAATIGGALSVQARDDGAWGQGPPELALALLSLDAALIYAGVNGSRLTVPLDAFATPPDGSFLAEVILPPTSRGETGALMRLARTPRDQAIAAAVAVVDMRGGSLNRLRLAVSGAGERPMRLHAVEQAIAGQALTPECLVGVEAQVAALVDPRMNNLGGIGYRREMAGLLARRAIGAAARRTA